MARDLFVRCLLDSSFFALGSVDFVIVTGTWILTGLGIVRIVQKVRRIRAVWNTDAADAAQ